MLVENSRPVIEHFSISTPTAASHLPMLMLTRRQRAVSEKENYLFDTRLNNWGYHRFSQGVSLAYATKLVGQGIGEGTGAGLSAR
jgi:hypothetical protein